MKKTKGAATRRKPRARPQTPRKRSRRAAPLEPASTGIPPATVHENDSEDQLGAYGDQSGETDVIQP